MLIRTMALAGALGATAVFASPSYDGVLLDRDPKPFQMPIRDGLALLKFARTQIMESRAYRRLSLEYRLLKNELEQPPGESPKELAETAQGLTRDYPIALQKYQNAAPAARDAALGELRAVVAKQRDNLDRREAQYPKLLERAGFQVIDRTFLESEVDADPLIRPHFFAKATYLVLKGDQHFQVVATNRNIQLRLCNERGEPTGQFTVRPPGLPAMTFRVGFDLDDRDPNPHVTLDLLQGEQWKSAPLFSHIENYIKLNMGPAVFNDIDPDEYARLTEFDAP